MSGWSTPWSTTTTVNVPPLCKARIRVGVLAPLSVIEGMDIKEALYLVRNSSSMDAGEAWEAAEVLADEVERLQALLAAPTVDDRVSADASENGGDCLNLPRW